MDGWVFKGNIVYEEKSSKLMGFWSQFYLSTLCGLQNLSSPTRSRTPALAVKAPNPNHLTVAEFPIIIFFLGPVVFIKVICFCLK